MSNTINALLNELDEFLIDSPEAARQPLLLKPKPPTTPTTFSRLIPKTHRRIRCTGTRRGRPAQQFKCLHSSAAIASIPRPTIKPLLAEKMRQDTIQEQALSQPSNRNRLPKGMDMPPSPVAIRSSMLQQSMPPPIYLSRTMSSNGAPAPNQTFNMLLSILEHLMFDLAGPVSTTICQLPNEAHLCHLPLFTKMLNSSNLRDQCLAHPRNLTLIQSKREKNWIHCITITTNNNNCNYNNKWNSSTKMKKSWLFVQNSRKQRWNLAFVQN
ncbi:hypothetical protein BCR33DRAFT_764752 [Rhizoclosmatium globosum]|uniref:Uncharacterized protein n=1 Tax=Rhizoclosmatium globosum TaxID=329046 RepID=A0A1Y2CHK0_9FUNG|nr:hypothetical protein BCR33DRAFT_764752 [Rhizoclosmatium globosum]|eukprot:ORY46387.1 hypothetical protein BCR33DRAFT_764752 [Rhizoclosmatium globosum]